MKNTRKAYIFNDATYPDIFEASHLVGLFHIPPFNLVLVRRLTQTKRDTMHTSVRALQPCMPPACCLATGYGLSEE